MAGAQLAHLPWTEVTYKGGIKDGRSLALNCVDDSCLATRRNLYLELHCVGAEGLTGRGAVYDLPLIIVVALDAFTHERFG